MKLFELNGVKRFNDMTKGQVLNYIRANMGNGSVKVLGSGDQGAALLVGNNVYKFWLRDSAYTDFVNYSIQQNNPYLPKFLSPIKQMPIFFKHTKEVADQGLCYVKMERLSRMPSGYIIEFNIPKDSPDYAKLGRVRFDLVANALQYLETDDPAHSSPADMICQLMKYVSKSTYRPEHIPPVLLGIASTLMQLAPIMHNHGHSFDLKEDNFMLRGNQIVLLDPVMNDDDSAAMSTLNIIDELMGTDPNTGNYDMIPGTTRRTNLK